VAIPNQMESSVARRANPNQIVASNQVSVIRSCSSERITCRLIASRNHGFDEWTGIRVAWINQGDDRVLLSSDGVP
jgi:hypothetical protein